ncbi:MAG: response regulator transcription factor [Clostridia bacterium]
MQILLVEDDELIAKGLTYSFKQNEYNLVHKTNIKDTSNFLQNEKIEFIILDISLPDGNGLDLYNNIIKKLNIPTIFLTAKDDEETIVKGLELGAEDYITKPFSTKELIVRMKKIILRTKKNQIIEIQDIKFDIDKMVVYRNKEKNRIYKFRNKNITSTIYEPKQSCNKK